MNAVDKQLTDKTYMPGAQFTAADIHVGSQIKWGMHFNSIDQRASFLTYCDRLTSRQAFIKANQLDDEATAN